MDNQIDKFLFLICMTLVLSGCVGLFHEVSEENVDFAKIKRLSDLDGSYQNQSEGASEQPTYYLSSWIWTKEKIEHNTIKTIEVKAINDNTIQVKGLGAKKEVKKESLLVEGKDFNLQSGRIVLGRKVGFFGETGPFVGPYTSGSELGLDRQGHGKVKHSTYFAGLIFMVLPAAIGERVEVRFNRIK